MRRLKWWLVAAGTIWGLGHLGGDGLPSHSVRASVPSAEAVQSRAYDVYYVTGNVVNVRTGPGTSYQRIDQVRKGDRVGVIRIEGGWAKLSSPSGPAWMSARYISATQPSAPRNVSKTPVVAQSRQSICHPNYSGKCVPIASDVDCAGGRGNGPAYVRGPVRVIGPDVYRLDRDGDGWACE